MPFWALSFVEFLHSLAAITWFGGAIWMKFVVKPALRKGFTDPLDPVLKDFLRRSTPIFAIAGTSTVLLGVLRGTVFGPINSWSVLVGTPYGNTWLVALIVALLTANLGGTGRLLEKILSSKDPGWLASGGLTMTLEWVELFGFATMLCCMVLMKFGM